MQNAKISGSGTIGGGKYDQVKISGSGKISGNIEAKEFKISGSGKVKGPMELSELKISGSFKCEDDIKCHTVTSNGSLKVLGDVETEIFTAKGSFHVDGLINTNELNVLLRGTCFAREIGGETIHISKEPKHQGAWIKLMIWFFGKGYGNLSSELIEGTSVYVEDTHTKVIRGEHIEIGPNCRVDVIEYSETIEVDPTSEVLSQNKI